VRAVDGVSLDVMPRQTLAVVGESGSGKSVTALATLGLLAKGSATIERGSITFQSRDGLVDLLTLGESKLRRVRGAQVAMIFQEPMTSLNPVYTVGEQIMEAVQLHQRVGRREARDIAAEALKEVSIEEPLKRMNAYPHQFSGGMRQRVMIAMALACKPMLLIADEPTTALDVTVQAQVLDLLIQLKETRGLSIMLITHAMGVVAENAQHVAVMYAGRVVESAPVLALFDRPTHPYTRGLLASIPGSPRAAVQGGSRRLTTVKDIVEQPGAFAEVGGLGGERAEPWWPKGTAQSQAGNDAGHGMTEIAAGHFVRCWKPA